MKQKHINSGVIYLARGIYFVLLLGFYLMFTFGFKPNILWYYLLVPFIILAFYLGIAWNLIMFIVEIAKAVRK